MLTVLRVSDHPAATWACSAGPWLRAHGATWRTRRAVLAPNAAWIAALKARALAARLPILGVEWLTPGRFRANALRQAARRGAATWPCARICISSWNWRPRSARTICWPAPLAPSPRRFRNCSMPSGNPPAGTPAILPDPAARELAAAARAKLRAQAGWITSTAAATDRVLREATANNNLPAARREFARRGISAQADWAYAPAA